MPVATLRRGTRRAVYGGAVSALSLLPSPTAVAQDAVELPPITVQDVAAPSLTAPSPEQAREALGRRPGGVALVPAEAFRDGRVSTPKDVLDYVPGVLAQPRWGEETRLSVRGSGLSRNFHLRGIRLLQDEVPINTADGGGDFQELDPLTFRYAEVFKGANALTFGSTTPGGVVNFATPTGRDWTPFQARFEGGSFGYYRAQASSGQSLGLVDYFISPTFLHADGYRRHTSQTSFRLNGNVGYRPNEAAETRFYLQYNNIDQEVPGALRKGVALSDPRSSPAVNFLNNYKRDIESVRLSNKTSFLLGDVQVTVGTYFLKKDLYHPIFQVVDTNYTDGGGFARVSGKATLAGLRNKWLLGTAVSGGTADDKRFVNVRGNRGAPTFDTREYAFNVEAYGENQTFIRPDMAIVVGAQAFYSSREGDDKFRTDGDQSSSSRYRGINPKLGAIWDVTSTAQLFGNVSGSAEVPTFSELNPIANVPGGASLKKQRAVTAEVGTRGRSAGGDYGWELAFYRSWIRNELQNFTLGNGQTFALNADRTVHQGIELGGDAVVLKNLLARSQARPDRVRLRGSYTYSDFFFDDDRSFGDNDLPGAPRHFIRAELLYEHPSGFYAGPNMEAVPQGYYVDNANTLKAPPYAIFGFRAGYRLENGASLFLDARNIGGRSYIATANVVPVATPANDALFFPGDGRAVFAGVEYRW